MKRLLLGWKNLSLSAKLRVLFFVFGFFTLLLGAVFFWLIGTGIDYVVLFYVIGSVGALLIAIIELWQGGDTRTGETTQERIGKLITALQDTTKLLSAIEEETRQREQLVTKLEQDLTTYNELVKLRESEVEAVAQLLRGELRKEGRRGLWQEILVNGFFFVAGILFTILTGIGG